MRIVAALLALLMLWPTDAGALSQSNQPSKFAIPWGNGAGAPYIRTIPQTSQIGIQNCAASLTDGFPPLTFIPATSGGCPPFGQDFNGIFRQLSQWAQWQAAGGTPVVGYDSSFSTSIGGYPNGATLRNASVSSCYWISTVDNNSSNPDTGGANWIASCPGGGIGGTSAGTANAQTITTTPFVTQVGATISFIAGLSNTSSLTIAVNGGGATQVFRRTQLGTSLSVGGEIVTGTPVQLSWDGTRWLCISCELAMVGAIRDFAGTSAPAGWLFIDGSCQAQVTYADLFTVVGTNYGSCGGGQFALPDGRGQVLAGRDNMGVGAANRLTSAGSGCAGTTLGVICGSQNYTLKQTDLPNVTLGLSSLVLVGANAGGAGSSNVLGTSSAVTTTSLNGGVTQTLIPELLPLQVVNKIIKF